MAQKQITLEDIKNNSTLKEYIKSADNYLNLLGYTKHGEIHAEIVSRHARDIVRKLGGTERDVELAAIAGFMHDIGNSINRYNHELTGAILAIRLLEEMGMDLKERIVIAQAIGNHDESQGVPCSNISAAVILADKCDVHRSRVRSTKFINEDIHDRVNYAVRRSFVTIYQKKRVIQLNLEVDMNISPVIEYFEIFMKRMIICKKAASHLDAKFELVINGSKLV